MKFSTEQLVERWEAQRAIKNLMGKYANCVILNREQDIFSLFWSKTRTDLSLGFNEGSYRGAEAVHGYYDSVYKRNKLVASLLQQRFPDVLGSMSEEDIYGIGPFKVKPLACPVIEIAADGKTAKGLWYCQGAYNDVETCGPVAHWTWGYFAADFIREGDDFLLWHLLYLNDVDCLCGQSWGKEPRPLPELPEFAPLADFHSPAFTESKSLRDLYTPKRPLVSAPQFPVPYDTFSRTFSYGGDL
jgi:hypothetical protein